MPWEKSFDINHALDKATRLFWSRGYDATSMQALVDQMGINRGSLYDTYGDKRSLFIAALRRYDHQFRRNRLAELERKHTPKAAIEALFKGWIKIALDDPGRSGCFLTNTAHEVAAHDAEIGAIVATSQRDTEKIFVRLIRHGQVSGEISNEIEPDLIIITGDITSDGEREMKFKFSGSFEDGKFSGTHNFVTKEGELKHAGTLTLGSS